MHHRLCEPPSIHLSFSLATVLPRRYAYRFSYDRYGVKTAPAKHTSFTAWTTRVSNPVCSPRFRASVSGQAQLDGFPIGIPVDLYAFHRSTYCSSSPYLPQDLQFALLFLS
jgi:hypothetical protein